MAKLFRCLIIFYPIQSNQIKLQICPTNGPIRNHMSYLRGTIIKKLIFFNKKVLGPTKKKNRCKQPKLAFNEEGNKRHHKIMGDFVCRIGSLGPQMGPHQDQDPLSLYDQHAIYNTRIWFPPSSVSPSFLSINLN